MLEELFKEHAGEIMSLLSSKYSLTNEQAGSAASSIIKTASDFFTNHLSSGKVDLNQVKDLFDKSTPNQSNPLFSALSTEVSSVLSSSGIAQSVVQEIAGNGLNDIVGIFQNGKLGNIDVSTITALVSGLTKGGGLSGLLGNLGGLFGKK